MGSGIKVVLLALVFAVLLGFTQMSTAEGAVGWNGFLRDIGFGGTQVYEVSDTVTIEAGNTVSPSMSASCLEGDWMFVGAGEMDTTVDVVVNPSVAITSFSGDLIREAVPFTKATGVEEVIVQIQNIQLFNIEATATVLCFSPSPLMEVGGEWHPTDTTALLIGYSVLNLYWIAPVGIGIGVGIYLVKRKI